MIRVGLPSPVFLRMRLRTHLALTHAARSAHAARLRVTDNVAAIAGSIRLFAPRRTAATVAEPEAPSVAMDLTEFGRQYDRLVDLLCFSAQGIVYGDADGRLSDLRAWFRQHYATVRPVLKPYLYTSTEPGASHDDFERLFMAEDVHALIHSDTLIPVIERTRAALEICLDEHRVRTDA